MDAVTIICLVGAFVIGAVIAWFVKGKGSSDKELEAAKLDRKSLEAQHDKLSEKLEEAMRENESLERQKDALSTNLDYMMKDRDRALAENKELAAKVKVSSGADLKEKYEKLLKEANDQCEKLDKELKNALNGKIDDAIKQKLADAETLKKKIQDLEDELDESQDDVSDLKKKIKGKDTEISDLQDSLTKEQNISKQLHTDLEEKKQELEKQKRELKLKKGALEFVQEILSAPEFGNEDTYKRNRYIDAIESFVKGPFTELNAYLYPKYKLGWDDVCGTAGLNLMKTYYYGALEQWAAAKRKSWLEGKTTVAFVGQFSAGKTSIVNRILSQDNPNIPLLPVSTEASTAIPTYIAGGLRTDYSFIAGDGKRKKILEDKFKEVSKDILNHVKGASSLIKYFVMEYKNPNLNGLSILDTPGFSSNDKEDEARTKEVINECDALFWVFDPNLGDINKTSIDVLKKYLKIPLYVVINKVDTKCEADLQATEAKIRQTLNREGLTFEKIIRFTNYEKAATYRTCLSNIMNVIKSVKKTTVRSTLVEEVRNHIEWLRNYLESNVKNLHDLYQVKFQEGETITDQFVACFQALQADCDKAADIPRWVEHTFSKDRYEMSPFEGTLLRNLLERIRGQRVVDLAREFNNRKSKAEEMQQAWSNKCDTEFDWKNVNECLEQYKKIIKSK